MTRTGTSSPVEELTDDTDDMIQQRCWVKLNEVMIVITFSKWRDLSPPGQQNWSCQSAHIVHQHDAPSCFLPYIIIRHNLAHFVTDAGNMQQTAFADPLALH